MNVKHALQCMVVWLVSVRIRVPDHVPQPLPPSVSPLSFFPLLPMYANTSAAVTFCFVKRTFKNHWPQVFGDCRSVRFSNQWTVPYNSPYQPAPFPLHFHMFPSGAKAQSSKHLKYSKSMDRANLTFSPSVLPFKLPKACVSLSSFFPGECTSGQHECQQNIRAHCTLLLLFPMQHDHLCFTFTPDSLSQSSNIASFQHMR